MALTPTATILVISFFSFLSLSFCLDLGVRLLLAGPLFLFYFQNLEKLTNAKRTDG